LNRTYPAAPADEQPGEPAKETMLTVNWMLDEVVDNESALALNILEHILIGTPAAPLYKALIDSGLGEALAGGGLDDELRQPMISIGLKGIDPVNADKIERLIADTISTLANKGIDPLTVDAALNTIEFRLRENNTGAFPRGIVFMLRALRSWLHGRDPLSPLAFEAPLAAIKAQVAGGERYFERLLQRHLVDNRHRTVLVLKPDRDLAEREAQGERARLEGVRASMTAQDLLALREATNTLRRMQE
jgi:Zn-dependent M16 (insulinase) family peptidase